MSRGEDNKGNVVVAHVLTAATAGQLLFLLELLSIHSFFFMLYLLISKGFGYTKEVYAQKQPCSSDRSVKPRLRMPQDPIDDCQHMPCSM